MKKAIALIVLGLIGNAAAAQTVSPLIAEFGKKISGDFTVSNNALTPQAVTIEAFSFGADKDGKPIYRALDSGIAVRLSETSARLGPKASRSIHYQITCVAYPCEVAIFADFVGLHTTNGIALSIHVPHVVYACEKVKGCRALVRKSWGLDK
jgi:hypothetical protein